MGQIDTYHSRFCHRRATSFLPTSHGASCAKFAYYTQSVCLATTPSNLKKYEGEKKLTTTFKRMKSKQVAFAFYLSCSPYRIMLTIRSMFLFLLLRLAPVELSFLYERDWKRFKKQNKCSHFGPLTFFFFARKMNYPFNFWFLFLFCRLAETAAAEAANMMNYPVQQAKVCYSNFYNFIFRLW